MSTINDDARITELVIAASRELRADLRALLDVMGGDARRLWLAIGCVRASVLAGQRTYMIEWPLDASWHGSKARKIKEAIRVADELRDERCWPARPEEPSP